MVGVTSVFANDFQFVKFKISVTASDDKFLAEITNMAYQVDVKSRLDSGVDTSLASGGKTINFNISYLDVDSIQVTPKGDATTKRFGIYDFTDVPNPTSFDVYIFDESGTQVAEEFRWESRGFTDAGT